MAFHVGDRVRWAHPEPSAEPDEMVGEVEQVIVTYRVKWDDGTIETVEENDLEEGDE